MSHTVIKVANLSKQYRLGEVGTGTLSHDINRWWHKVRGKEDPFLKVGEENNRSVKGTSEYVWALKDISFEVKQGEVLGIIGRNGAGKSTLLKLLSRTTTPTTGSIKVKGRIASLLEVGTGFHPELSGRENIFLNGAILGMTKQEIQSKFDEIVDFAGVERYIDTPVKRYSSGMYVRLAFGVAAHLEPEILIVDEVLAVGDAEFQKKALGKMKDVSTSEGRTVLFVSHNMAAITNLCNSALFLNNGKVFSSGPIQNIIDDYISLGKNNTGQITGEDIKYTRECPLAHFNSITILTKDGITNNLKINEQFNIELKYTVTKEASFVYPNIQVLDKLGTCVFATFNGPSVSLIIDEFYGKALAKGVYKSTVTIPANFLNNSIYKISAYLIPENPKELAMAEEAISFSIEETGEMTKEFTGMWPGMIRPKLAWVTELLKTNP